MRENLHNQPEPQLQIIGKVHDDETYTAVVQCLHMGVWGTDEALMVRNGTQDELQSLLEACTANYGLIPELPNWFPSEVF